MPPAVTTLAVIGDVHHELGKLRRVLAHVASREVSGILFVGDLGSHHVGLSRHRTPSGDARYLADVAEVLDAARALGVDVAYVPGNHDLPELDLPGNCDGAVVEVGGLRVGGIGGAGPAKFGFAYEWSEAEVRARPPLDCDVLLCHCPPLGVQDRTRGGDHAGSRAILERAEQHRGFLVCGHIHEAPGVARVGECVVLNAGGLGRPYGAAQVGYIQRGPDGDRAWHVEL